MHDKIARRTPLVLSPWVTLMETDFRPQGGSEPNVYHSFRQLDYVTVLGVTDDGLVPLVRQFRPVLQRDTWELPGGLCEEGEGPVEAAMRELAEEAGFIARDGLSLLACLDPDTGRLENRMFCYFAGRLEPLEGWTPEPGVQRELMSIDTMKDKVLNGEFSHALHIAVIGIASLRGLF